MRIVKQTYFNIFNNQNPEAYIILMITIVRNFSSFFHYDKKSNK